MTFYLLSAGELAESDRAMKATLFYRTCTKKAEPRVVDLWVEVSEDSSLEEILAFATIECRRALAARADKGVFEVQTDLGIYSRGADANGREKVLFRRDGTAYDDVTFTPWEDGEVAELTDEDWAEIEAAE